MSKIDELLKQYCPNGVEYKKLGDVCNLIAGFAFQSRKFTPSGVPICKTTNIVNNQVNFNNMEYYDPNEAKQLDSKFIVSPQTIVIGMSGTIKVGINNTNKYCYLNQRVGKFIPTAALNNQYLYYILCNSINILSNGTSGASVKNISNNDVLNLSIPVPPLPVQDEIVKILDKFTQLEAELEAELEARKKQYEYYRDQLLTFGDEVEWKLLGDFGDVRMCKRILKEQTSDVGEIPFYKIGTFGQKADAYISSELFNEYKSKYNYPRIGDVLISASGTIGRSVIFDGDDAYFQDSNIVWLEHNENEVLNKYLFYCYQIAKWNIAEGGTIQRLYNDNLKKTKIPIPFSDDVKKSLAEQARIVSILDKFDSLVNDISVGLPAEIAARRQQYEYYRDKLLNFPQIQQGA